MAKQKKQQEARKPTAGERLGLRVSAMINAPRSQLERRVVIHRLDDDPDEAWNSVLELLNETDGLALTFNDDGTVLLQWDRPTDEDQVIGGGEVEPVEEVAPF